MAPTYMNIWPNICDKIILPISDYVLRSNIKDELVFLREFQWSNADKIQHYQNVKFKELVDILFDNVPYYSAYFKKKKLNKHDFESVKDIKKLPILTKQIIKENFQNLLVNSFRGKKYTMKSSGSTGVQTEVLIDKKINSSVLASQLLFWEWGGFKMGTPHLQTGMSLRRVGVKKLKDLLFRCDYVSAFGLDDKSLQKISQILVEKKIEYIFGYASSIYLIANYCAKNKLSIKLKKIFTWGDCLYPNYRTCIEAVFSTSIHDCYGLGEGLQVASQCEFTDSLHVNQSKVIVEVTDSLGEKDCEKGELGKLLVTRLTPGPMPLVRYDTGDISSLVEQKCQCGRELQSISRVYGRDTDIIRSPLGDRLIVHFFTQIFEMIPEIKQFQVRQDKIEEIDIFYVPNSNFYDKILAEIESEIHANCKFNFKVNFKKTIKIPLLKSNKRRFVVSTLPVEL